MKDVFKELLYIATRVEKSNLAHFFGSSVLLLFASLFVKSWIAYVIVLASVAFKDFVWDKLWGKGQFSWKDIVYGSLPVIFDIINKL